MPKPNERGIAIVLALFLMSAMSILAASLMFLSQTETYASMNYRMMSQARYGGEAAVQRASNFLLDGVQYTIPSGVTELAKFNRANSPVTCATGCAHIGDPVILSASAAQASNYPVASVQTAFNTAVQGSLAAGNISVGYSAYAKLMHMQVFDSYGGGQAVVQTWQITGLGSLGGTRNATVEVTALVETPKVPANPYAAFATANTCDAIYFHGNVTVDSYDSRDGPPGNGVGNSTQDSGGDVGTNGNLHVQGSVSVKGHLYTPRPGVGTCTAGAVTGLSGSLGDVTGGVVPLPTEVAYPLPVFSATPPTTTVNISGTLNAATCTSLGLVSGTNCTFNAATKTITVNGSGTDVTLPSVVVAGGYKLILSGNNPANNININSLTGSGDIEVKTSGAANESVVLKIAGKNPDGTEMTTPFDLSTMAWKQNNPTGNYDASTMQIVYGGTATIAMGGGNSQSAATVYAPNANFSLQGTQDFFGSILAKTITNGGNASIHYDRRLGRDFFVAGHPMMGTFTWNRY